MDRRDFIQFLFAASLTATVLDVAHAAPQGTIDLSTPEATVKSFIAALNQVDSAGVAKCVIGATESDILKELMKEPVTLTLGETTAYYTEAKDRALVETTLIIQTKQGESKDEQKIQDMVPLRKEGTDWKIVPLDMEALKTATSKPTSQAVVQVVATMVRNPEIMRESRKAAVPTAAMSNVKQICLGTIMYSQDYDEKLPPSAAKFKTDIMPYIKNEAVFTSPLDPAGTESFKLNPQIAGKTTAIIQFPENTVMIYEGEYKKPLYRYEGKAIIGFADGHVMLLTPEEVAKLRWSY